MKVTCNGFQIQWTNILIVNSASVRLTFNPECFFLSLFPSVVLGFGFLFKEFFRKTVESDLFFSFLGKSIFFQKKTFQLSANSQGYRGIFCNKLPSENRLAAALILRTAGFLGCGENEMVQLIEVMTEPRWVNYLDVLSSHPEYSREEKCQGSYFPLWQQTAAKSCD